LRPSITHHPEMKVIAFITEHDVVDAIHRHLERKKAQEARAPPC